MRRQRFRFLMGVLFFGLCAHSACDVLPMYNLPMALLDNTAIDTYLSSLSEQQSSAIRSIRGLIIAHICDLDERIDEGKWFGGLLTYYLKSGQFLFALGPRSNGRVTFHMMAYYVSKELQERHGEALKPHFSGKSCITFSDYGMVSKEALTDIIKNAPALGAYQSKSKQKA